MPWVATFIALGLFAVLLLPLTLTDADNQRENAFIGYKEESGRGKGSDCTDKFKECPGWQNTKECIMNPSFMRASCPATCRICPEDLRKQTVLRGYATPEGTKLFSIFYPASSLHAVAETHFRYDPSMGDMEAPGQGMRLRPWLTLSSLGVGTYLGEESDAEDQRVIAGVVRAVSRGCNVIDSARNYRNGRGEESVGQALQMLAGSGVERRSLFVSTKAGFLPGALRDELLAGHIAADDVVGGNCIHPACIRASLQQSLAALKLQAVDLFYLHNPAETQMSPLGREPFLQRLLAAFRELEHLRKEGKIQSYGMATWACFRVAPGSTGYLALQDVVDVAVKAGGLQHGFRYVQLPVNVGMREAWEQPWQPLRAQSAAAAGAASQPDRKVPLTKAAAQLGVGVMASGPLGEGSVLQEADALKSIMVRPELRSVQSPAVAALLVAKSTPFLITAVVGMKGDHVDENLAVTALQLLTRQDFVAVMSGSGKAES